MTIKRAVVTGGAGFIGSHIVDALVSRGAEVTVIDNLSSGKRANVPDGVRLEEMDIRAAELRTVVADARPDAVFHLAAQMDVRKSVEDPLFDCHTNVYGTVNVLESALLAGAQRFVVASTGGAMYGDVDEIPTPETVTPDPESPYGISKFCAERYVRYYNRNGLPGTVLRLGNVYGPRQDPHGEAGVVAIFGSRLLAGTPCTIFGDGEAVRDYVHVSDVARAFLAATETPGGLFNIGTGVGTSVNALYGHLAAAAGSTEKPAYAEARKGELQVSILNPGLARATLGWTAQVGVAEGLAAYTEFLEAKQAS